MGYRPTAMHIINQPTNQLYLVPLARLGGSSDRDLSWVYLNLKTSLNSVYIQQEIRVFFVVRFRFPTQQRWLELGTKTQFLEVLWFFAKLPKNIRINWGHQQIWWQKDKNTFGNAKRISIKIWVCPEMKYLKIQPNKTWSSLWNTLWLFNSSPWKSWPIYRWFTWVYLLKMLIFHGYVSHNQRVCAIPGASPHKMRGFMSVEFVPMSVVCGRGSYMRYVLRVQVPIRISVVLFCNFSLRKCMEISYETPFEDQFPNKSRRFPYLAVCQNLVPLVNIKIAGKWMFIPLKMVLIGIDPYPSMSIFIYQRVSTQLGPLT